MKIFIITRGHSMQSITFILVFFTTSLLAQTYPAKLKPLTFDEVALKVDLELILKEAQLPVDAISVRFKGGESNTVFINCVKEQWHLEVEAIPEEKGPTFYKGLRELGFLFPHPQRQISPTPEQMKKTCGKSFIWKPTLKIRGFHLHTLHPSEWTHGFLMGKPGIATATIRWVARNGQNALDIILLKEPWDGIEKALSPLYLLAQSLGIYTGISIGIVVQQQKTFRLLSLWESLWDSSIELVASRLDKILKDLPLSYVTLEAGSSEFTPTNYERTIKWLNAAADVAEKNQVALFTKVHVSSNQHDKKYGNYNFLPQYARPNVGVWPHTVFFYGLLDKSTPIYGNKDFSHMRAFMEQEKSKRPTWYYPETGYWIGLDQDVPLFLTDYLRTRSEDVAWLSQEGLEGQVNFTTGHALGGWLYDWNLALITDADYNFSPLIAPMLLGEDVALWRSHLNFQKVWFKEQQLIPLLTSANLQDELSSHRIHDRFIMRELSGNLEQVKKEIALLEEAWKHWPSIEGIRDVELFSLFTLTKMRHEHAINLRKAFLGDKDKPLKRAEELRNEAKMMIAGLRKLPTNYPQLPEIFEQHKNPTSYQFGYVYLAASLYFWEREETQVREDSFLTYWPFTGNIIDVWEILF
jgi:hypothetical protein